MRISDWSSDVCSSDLQGRRLRRRVLPPPVRHGRPSSSRCETAPPGVPDLHPDPMTPSPRTSGYDRARRAGGLLALVLVAILTVVLSSQPAHAQEAPVPPAVPTPRQPDDDASVTPELPDVEGDPHQSALY